MTGPVRPPWRVVVAGTNFGRVHAAGVRSDPGAFTLAGILSRGSERSRREARELGVPHLSGPDAVPDDVDAACVAVGSAVSGGEGTELACALLERGIAVLAEHPVHPDEIARCLRVARAHGTMFRVSTHYPHVAPVRRFLDAAARLRARQPIRFVDAATPVHVLHPFLDVLGRALGGVRPWAFAEPADWPAELTALAGRPSALTVVSAVLGGIPVTLRVHNALHPGDRDNHALLWHRIALGTDGGVLTLADTHGPVLWSPRLHARRDAEHRLILDDPALDLPATSLAAPAPTQRHVTTTLWAEAVAHALRELRAGVEAGTDALRAGQWDLTVARTWVDLVARIGPPRSERPPPPEILRADEVLGPDDDAPDDDAPDDDAPAGVGADAAASSTAYGATAEFYDLAALGTPEIGAALAGADPDVGPVVEIGAGSGLVTAAIARALPGARVLAAEPSTVLRAVLMSRVVRDADLRARVTVVPHDAASMELPDRISAAVVCGVAGHLRPDERRALWRRLLDRLAPGAPLVVELAPLDGPMEPLPLARARVGRAEATWWFSAAADSDGAATEEPLTLHSRWEITGGPAPRTVAESYAWYPVTLADVAEETGRRLTVLRETSSGNAAPLGVLH